MALTIEDKSALRPLAEQYADLSALDIQAERLGRYYKTISLENVRPVVLIDEVPWGEIRDDELTLRCEDDGARQIEMRLRRALYQWKHFQVDYVIPPTFRVMKRIRHGGIGLEVQDVQIHGDTGAYIASHAYEDQLQTEDEVAKLTLPEISFDKEATTEALELAESVFAGLMPVEVVGTTFQYSIWDQIATYRGVDNLLIDLAMRPEFTHTVAKRFMEIGQAEFGQLLELGLLDTNPIILHCTPACTRELPATDFDGTVRPKDVWGRCAAQIFSAVSPDMHDEFDLTYNQELFKGCGLLYYGCCEPLDNKIELLRKRFPNLRKISITPWADPEIAARSIGKDYVLAGKPNPAFVNSRDFSPGPVEEEIGRYLEACKRHGTTCEFVLKDISTIDNAPETLTKWAQTVSGVIDRYY